VAPETLVIQTNKITKGQLRLEPLGTVLMNSKKLVEENVYLAFPFSHCVSCELHHSMTMVMTVTPGYGPFSSGTQQRRWTILTLTSFSV